VTYLQGAHTDARRRRRIFNVGRVLALDTIPAHTDVRRRIWRFIVGGVVFLNPPSYKHAEEEE
jgi:hypothetical protein